MKAGFVLGILYCLYVIAAKATFSIGWLLFWVFFQLIFVLGILFFILLCIGIFALYLKFFSSKENKEELLAKLSKKCYNMADNCNTLTDILKKNNGKDLKDIAKIISNLNNEYKVNIKTDNGYIEIKDGKLKVEKTKSEKKKNPQKNKKSA